MTLYYVVQDLSKVPLVSVDEGGADLECATVVLQHPGGVVGFERDAGTEVIRAIVGDVVVIECANAPHWSTMARQSVASRLLHSKFRRVLTCSDPSSVLLRELESVSLNRVVAKKNEISARHGRPLSVAVPTMFDAWALPNGLVHTRVLSNLVHLCSCVAFWAFADWGLHARIVAATRADAIAPIVQAGQVLGLPVRQVSTESELPTW